MADKLKIVVLDGYTLNPGDNPWTDIAAFGNLTVHDRTSENEILVRSRDADILLTNKTPLTADTLAQLPRLKYIGVMATGFNVVDTAAAKKRGIPITNVPEYGTASVAQYVFALLLELCHRVGLHSDAVAAGQWHSNPDFCFWNTPLVELAGKTMGIIGFGRIGRNVGELAHAFGMNVLAVDIYQGNAPDYLPFSWATEEEAFGLGDVISLNCALNADNQGFVNKRRLERMKKSAFLINTARGKLVNETDLAEALANGEIAGAGLDVVSTEPIRKDNPLLGVKNCLITPHIAWASLDSRKRLMRTVANNLKGFLQGNTPNQVN